MHFLTIVLAKGQRKEHMKAYIKLVTSRGNRKMGNSEHLAILKQGVVYWNLWRRENPEIIPNLSGFNLRRANLRAADLSGVNLRWTNLSNANLLGANLSNSDLAKANLREADLYKANLKDAKVSGAHLIKTHLRQACLQRCDLSLANLNGADLTEASFKGANLSGADLDASELRNADLSETHLSNAILSNVNLANADLRRSDLTNANLEFADLSNANLSDAKLSTANFSNSNLQECDLSNATINQSNLSYANLTDAVLIHANLSNANLSHTNLKNADFSNAILSNANLSNSNLEDTILSDAILINANLSGANLNRAQLISAKLDADAAFLIQYDLGVSLIMITHDQDEAPAISSRIAVMNQGRIEQIGTPVEVYDCPSSAFVADFVSEANLFECRVIEQDGAFVELRSSTGLAIVAAKPRHWLPIPEAVVSIRPEKIKLSTEYPNQSYNTYRGILNNVLYLGDHSQFVVDLHASENVPPIQVTLVSSNHQGEKTPPFNSQVYVSWMPEDCVALPKTTVATPIQG